MKVVVRYLLIGRRYHRGISSGRPAGCEHMSDSRVFWQDSRACWAKKLARVSRPLDVQDLIISSPISWRYRVKVIIRSLRFSSGISGLASSVRQEFVLQSLNALRVISIPLPHSFASRSERPAADLASIGD